MYSVDDVPLNLHDAERMLVIAALKIAKDRKHAAELLGVTRYGLRRRMDKHAIAISETKTLSLVPPPDEAC